MSNNIGFTSGRIVNSAGSRIYSVGDAYGGSTVTVVDTATDSVLKRISTNITSTYGNTTLVGCSISNDGNTLYTLAVGTNSSQVSISLTTDTQNSTPWGYVGANSAYPGFSFCNNSSKVFCSYNTYVSNVYYSKICIVEGAGAGTVISAGDNGGGGNAILARSVSATDTKAFACGNNIAVINLSDNSISTAVSAGGNNNAWSCLSPDKTKMYAGYGGSIVVFNTSTNTIITTITAGLGGPRAGVCNSTGTKLFVADGNYVKIIDTATNAITATIPTTITTPTGLALLPDDSKLYISNGFTVVDIIAGGLG